MTRRHRLLGLSVVSLAVGLAVGCRPGSVDPLALPSNDRLLAKPQAVGVPYDRCLLLRYDRTLVVLRITSRTSRGEHIAYQWWEARSRRGGFTGREARHGSGASSEAEFTGWIDLPGRRLEWSRGSSEVGWIYWPEDGRELEVYSRSWLEIDEVDGGIRGGRWLRRPADGG